MCALTRHRERAMMNIIVFTQLFIYTQKPLTHNTIYCFFVYKWLLCVVYMWLNIHTGWMRIYASWDILLLPLLHGLLSLDVYIFDVYKYYFSYSAFLTCLSLISCHYSSFSSIKKALIHFLFDHGGVKLLICNET